MDGPGSPAASAEFVRFPPDEPLLAGPAPAHVARQVGLPIVGGLAVLAWLAGELWLPESQWLEEGWGGVAALVVVFAGFAVITSLRAPPSFAVFGDRLVRPGRPGVGFTFALADATCAETRSGGVRVEAGGVGVETPPGWPGQGLLVALVEAAQAGLLHEAERLGASATVSMARRGQEPGALLAWVDVVLFLPHAAAREGLALVTGRPPPRLATSAGVLQLLELLDGPTVRRALPGLRALPGARVWPLHDTIIVPFPPFVPAGKGLDDRSCALVVGYRDERLEATLTWREAQELAPRLGLSAPQVKSSDD